MKTILFATSALILPAIAFAAADAGTGAAGGKPAAETAEKPKEPKAPKRGIGTVAMEAILASKSNEEALAAVRKEFPDANTTKASINWYRNKARKDEKLCTSGAWNGKPVPNARDMNKAAKAAAEGKDGAKATAADNKPKAADPTA